MATDTDGVHQFQNIDNQQSWYKSVLQWQEQSGVTLVKNVEHTNSGLVSLDSIMKYCRPENRDQCQAIINAYDINVLQDITAQSRGQYRERLVDHPVNTCLTASIPAILNSEPNILQMGKMYLNVHGQVEEFSGVHQQDLRFRQWTPQNNSKTVKVNQFIRPTEFKIRSEDSLTELIGHVHCLAEENLDGTTHGIKIIAMQPEKPPEARRTTTRRTQLQNNLRHRYLH